MDTSEIFKLTSELTDCLQIEGNKLTNLDREPSVQESLSYYNNITLIVEKIYRSGFIAGERSGYTKLN